VSSIFRQRLAQRERLSDSSVVLAGRGIKKRDTQTQLEQPERQSFEEREKTQKETYTYFAAACDEAARKL
jgi:hypothetical protein